MYVWCEGVGNRKLSVSFHRRHSSRNGLSCVDWLCPSRSSGSFCFSGLQDCSSERELKSCWNQAEKSCVQRYFFVLSSLNLFELFLQLLQWLLSFSESFSGGTTKLWKSRNKMQQQPLNIKFVTASWLSACGRGDWSRKWKLTRDSGVTSSRWLLMLCGVGIPTVKVSYPILQQHFSLYENTVGMAGMEKCLLLAVTLHCSSGMAH